MIRDRVRSVVGNVREVLETANDLVGRPFGGRAEKKAPAAPAAVEQREAAPVMLYFDGKDHRTKKKIEELLGARGIAFKLLDVTDDEATRSWALSAAKQAEFPLVFVAGEPIGGLHELTQADVNGQGSFGMPLVIGVADVTEGGQENIAYAGEMIDEIPLDISEDRHTPFQAADPGGRTLALAQIETAEVAAAAQGEEQAVLRQGNGAGQAKGPAALGQPGQPG